MVSASLAVISMYLMGRRRVALAARRVGGVGRHMPSVGRLKARSYKRRLKLICDVGRVCFDLDGFSAVAVFASKAPTGERGLS